MRLHKPAVIAAAATLTAFAALGMTATAQAATSSPATPVTTTAIVKALAPPPPNGAYPIKPQYAQTYCIEQTSENQNALVLLASGCNSNEDELFYNAPSSWDGGSWLEIVNWITGKCLQDPNNGGSGTKLNMYTCNNSESQAWTSAPYSAWELGDGLCMDGTANNDITAHTCNLSHSQSWVW